MKPRFRARLVPLLAALACGGAHAAATDVRVLIDVSGSMKKTDPGNLRVPALKLLAELLPEGAKAGVWLFDQGVSPLLPPATVDAAWKQNARGRATRIHSRGLYTNIEAALAAASADWADGPAADGGERHIVLLTDGVVDVAKDQAVSAASRARVLGEMVTSLKGKAVHVHTVALSADVDRALLDALASATGGWREDAPTADALQRAFLHMFEQAAAPDTVPLKGNSFHVDASVRELTLLVFRGADDVDALTLTGPDRVVLSAEAPGDHSRWQAEEGYDLVTIEAPAPGKWVFSGNEDPDNRALIVTDLDLKLGEMPANVLPGEQVPLSAQLLEQGQPISREDFLELTRASVAFVGKDGAGDMQDLPLDTATQSFRGAAGRLPPGPYEVIVRAESATFEREIRRRLRVYKSPVALKAVSRPAEGADGPLIRMGIAVNPKLVDPASVSGYVLTTDPAGNRNAVELPALTKGKAILDIPATLGGDYALATTVLVETLAGRSLRLQPDALSVKVEGPAAAAAADAPPPPPPPPPAPTIGYAKAAAIVGAGNVALGAVLGPLWFGLRRRGLPVKGVSL
jgi:uncharacterized protein (TIGR03503 family)